MKADPVQRRGAANQVEAVFGEIEQDDIADHMAVVAARDELLGLVDREALEAVDAQVVEQLEGVGPFDQQVGHMIGLVEQDAGLLPGPLLVTPVGEFRRHAGIDVWSGRLVAQQVDYSAR